MKEMNAVNKIILLIPILLLPLSSCSNKEDSPVYEFRVNSVYKTILEEFFELHKEEYIEKYYNDENVRSAAINITNNENWYPSANDMGIIYSFGEYDGVYVFIPYFLSYVSIGYDDLTSYEICDGVTMYSDLDSRYFDLQVYKDGVFYDFKTAYQLNIISLDSANTISQISSIILPWLMHSEANIEATFHDNKKDSIAYIDGEDSVK